MFYQNTSKPNLINTSTWEETWQTRNQETPINSKVKATKRLRARLPQPALRVNRVRVVKVVNRARSRVKRVRVVNRARVAKRVRVVHRAVSRILNHPDKAAASKALGNGNRARARVARVVKTSKVVASRVKVPSRVEKAAKRTTIISN